MTEERTITTIDGDRLTLDEPLKMTHLGEGDYRGEVANLRRNVDRRVRRPERRPRPHDVSPRLAPARISYAEFRHLGKKDVLGRYRLHFHLCRRHDARQLPSSAPRSGTATIAG